MSPESEPVTVRLDVETRIEWVEVVLGVFERHCAQCGYEPDATHWMGAAVREAVTNGMRHGNRMDPTKRLRIQIETRDGSGGGPAVRIAVEDEGEGFDTAEVPDPLLEDNLLKDSGRGIFFMRQFMDGVTWTRTDRGGTRVVLIQRQGLRTP